MPYPFSWIHDLTDAQLRRLSGEIAIAEIGSDASVIARGDDPEYLADLGQEVFNLRRLNAQFDRWVETR